MAVMAHLPRQFYHAGACVAASGLRLHPLDEHLRRLRAHDPRVRQLALAELLAQVASADRHLLVTLRGAFLDQPDSSKLLVERCEADLHWLDLQVALQLIELPL